jgi:hypothetical protein
MKLYFDGTQPSYICNYIDYEVTNIKNCDYILSCKFNWGMTDFNTIQNNLNSYKSVNKYVIVFLITDSTDKFSIPDNVYFFRTSLYKKKLSNNEFILPYVWENIDKKYFILSKTSKPIIGFCGNIDQYREKTISTLQKENNIYCNFIIRNQFWGGKPNDPTLRNEFINNIVSSHFTICNRGKGNFSMRFYQVLSAGRIPALIDSDMIFPFEDEINWKDIIVVGKNENDMLNKIFDIWNNKDIIFIQNKCREIYYKYFLNKNYFIKIFNHINFITHKNKNYDNIEYHDILDVFDVNIYKKQYNIKSLNEIELINHFINHEINENKIHKLPHDFDINIYNKYKDLLQLNNDEIINHFINHGINENRIYKLPDDFNINIYNKYKDLSHLNNDELINHFINHGINENRIYKLPDDFDIKKYYKNLDSINLSEEELIIFYINHLI